MRNVLAIARRELSACFISPLAYVVTAAFLAVNGIFFYIGLYNTQSADLQQLFPTIYTILLLLSPILSMRLLAEEQSTGTIELLLTSPVRDVEVVLGKFLAGFGLVAAMLAMTLVYPILLFALGSPDAGVTATGYLGALLFGAAGIAIGLFASSLTRNQIVAAVISFAALLVLWVIDGLAASFGSTVGSALSYLSLWSHFGDLSRGLLDTKDIVYFLSLAVAALFLTTRALEVRRWKG